MNKIIDMHTHIFPAKIAEKAVASISTFYGIPMGGAGLSDDLIRRGKKHNIVGFLISSAATKAEQVQSINDFIHQETLLHKELYGFGSLHPAMEQPEAEIERIKTMGLHGIKLHPDFQQFNIDDPIAFPIYKKAQEEGLPILFHMGDKRYEFSRPVRLARILDKFPALVSIAAHMGGYTAWDEALETIIGHKNVYLDTCSSLAFISKEKALKIIYDHGVDRVFFGTDYPMFMYEDELKLIDGLALPNEDYGKIMYQNGARFLGLTPES